MAVIIKNQKAFIPTNGGKNVVIKATGDVGINRDAVIKILKKQPQATAPVPVRRQAVPNHCR